MIRRAVVRAVLVLSALVVTAVQWWVTSPGVVTDLEFRTLLLVSAPALAAILSLAWVESGRPLLDPRGGDDHAAHRRARG